VSLPPTLAKRLPRYPTLPAFLVGRLAVDRRYQGQGIGRRLLMSALGRSLELRTQIGAIGVIVDAKDDAARAFYEHYDFQRFEDNPYRLILSMKTMEQLLGG
jgi:GNAT superfamily N-acetyltransferase